MTSKLAKQEEAENEILLPVNEIKDVVFVSTPKSYRIIVRGRYKSSWEEYFDKIDFIQAKKRFDFLRAVINQR